MSALFHTLKISSNYDFYTLTKSVQALGTSSNIILGNIYPLNQVITDYLITNQETFGISKVEKKLEKPDTLEWLLTTDVSSFNNQVAKSFLESIKNNILDKYDYPSYVYDDAINDTNSALYVGKDPKKVSATQSQANSAPITTTQNISQGNTQAANSAPTDTGVAQEDSRGDILKSDTNTNKIGKDSIVPNSLVKKFGPNKTILGVKPIKFNLSGIPDQSKEEFASGLGYVPFVWYNSYQIEPNNIKFFSLFNDGILPRVKILFVDPVNLLSDTGFPLDDSKVQVFLNSRDRNIKSIFMQFKITNFSLNDCNKYSIEGTCDVSKMYTRKFKAYKDKTSNETLQELCKEMGLGFYTNIDNTDDKMTWINPANPNIDFIEDVLLTSYKSDEAYMTGYVDYYYSFNYVDIEKELSRNVDDQLGIHVNGLEQILNLPNKDKVSKLFLTNDKSMKNSPNYFEDYRILNNSTQISLEKGYLNKVKFYDTIKKEFLIFDVDSITTTGDKTIILKSGPQDNNFFNDNAVTTYTGKIDTDNMHKNYNYSYIQNTQNIDDLKKIGIEVIMPNPNYNFYRYQKIKVLLSNQTSTPSQSIVINRLSGDWLIIDIKFVFKDSKIRQYMTLVKRELELSQDELNREPNMGKTKEKPVSISPNPEPQTTNPIINLNAQPSGLTSSQLI